MLKTSILVIARTLLVLSIPVFLLLANLYALMSPAFLRYEYGKADFPPSPGFTDEQRLMVAEKAVTYLRSDAGIEILGDLEGEEGPLFREKELIHMADVKVLTRQALLTHGLVGLLIALSLGVLLGIRGTQGQVSTSLLQGSLLTIALLVAVVALIYLNFDALRGGHLRHNDSLSRFNQRQQDYTTKDLASQLVLYGSDKRPFGLCYLTLSRFCGITILKTKLSLNTPEWQKTTKLLCSCRRPTCDGKGFAFGFLVSEKDGCS